MPVSSGHEAGLNRQLRSICLHLTARLSARHPISPILKAFCMSTDLEQVSVAQAKELDRRLRRFGHDHLLCVKSGK